MSTAHVPGVSSPAPGATPAVEDEDEGGGTQSPSTAGPDLTGFELGACGAWHMQHPGKRHPWSGCPCQTREWVAMYAVGDLMDRVSILRGRVMELTEGYDRIERVLDAYRVAVHTDAPCAACLHDDIRAALVGPS